MKMKMQLHSLFHCEVLSICAAARVYLMALLFNSLDIFTTSKHHGLLLCS
jgi:hypothetical protein